MRLCTNLLYTMPDCLIKTIESLRKHKLEHWDRNRETNRAWLSLNMMTEARAGFRAFHYGSKEQREVDFILLAPASGGRRAVERRTDRRDRSLDRASGSSYETLRLPMKVRV